MTQINRLRDAEIENGNLINADDLDAEFDLLFNESNAQDNRLTALESENFTFAGIKTFGAYPVLPATNPSLATHAATKGYVDTLIASGNALPAGYNCSSAPVYATSSTITIAKITCRSDADDADIKKPTSTTVNTGSVGLNGIAQSSNLAGAITVSSGSATVTGVGTSFASAFIAGDVITTAGGQARRVLSVASNTSLTVASNFSSNESGVAFKRGGRAASTWYYLYFISDGTTPGAILTTRSIKSGDTLEDMPTGYTKTRQDPFALWIDSSSNIEPFVAIRRGGSMKVRRLVNMIGVSNGTTFAGARSFQNGNFASTSYATFDLSAWIPKTARLFDLVVANTDNHIVIRPTGGTAETYGGARGGSGNVVNEILTDLVCSSTQQIDIKTPIAGSNNIGLDVYAYTVTEV